MNELNNIDRYETIDLLGRGGMGSVYLARDPLIDRYVAVKVLDSAFDSAARERFTREARAAGRLHHPNIVTIFDVGEHQGRPFIAMEFVPGHTLAALIQQKRLSLVETLRLVADACAGLAYAHRAGIVHLDIKPENLIRHDSGVLKVLDFGIARVLTTDTAHTQSILGTLRYMAPEQVRGQALDRRSDVFALGCVLYEAIAGEPVFKGTVHDLLSRVMNPMPVPSLADVVPGVPPELVRMTARAVAASPDDRYDDLEVLRRELEALRRQLDHAPEDTTQRAVRSKTVEGAGRSAPETTGLNRAAEALDDRTDSAVVPAPKAVNARRRRRLAWAVAAVGLFAAGAGALWLSRLDETSPLASRAAAEEVEPARLPVAPPPTPATGEAGSEAANLDRAAVSGRGDAAGVEKQVWRLLAQRDRSGALTLLRAQRGRLSDRLMNELVAAARTSATAAQQAADRRDRNVASSRPYRSGVDELDHATALLAGGESIDAIAALWQAADLFVRAGADGGNAGAAEPPGPSSRAEPGPSPSRIEGQSSPLAGPLASTSMSAPPASAPNTDGAPVGPARPVETAEDPPDRAEHAAGGSAPVAPAPEESIRAVLKAYEAAYDGRDAAALRRIVPGLSSEQWEAVTRTFADAVSYDVDLTLLAINVTGSTATATCLVAHALVPKIGSASRNAPLETRFHLRQTSAGWVIERIERGSAP
ncbi:MAG: protein kinase domain-containing protein [Vicinamibacterales bacterium]